MNDENQLNIVLISFQIRAVAQDNRTIERETRLRTIPVDEPHRWRGDTHFRHQGRCDCSTLRPRHVRGRQAV